MDYKEAVEFFGVSGSAGTRPSPERIAALLEALGQPQKKMKFVHIAGTNGKGSTAAMTASVLRCCGYKTGLFTSPHLYRFNERMQINGLPIEDAPLCELADRVKGQTDRLDVRPTGFERTTAAALLWFAQEECDVVVLETGLGGRFDATNVIDNNECSIITHIGLDHTAILGDTVEKIAAEKAGIIKPGCPCVLYAPEKSVEAVIRSRCEALGSPLTLTDPGAVESIFDSLEGQAFTYKDEMYALPLLGRHQLYNAAVVLEAVNVLRSRGWRLPKEDVEHGLYAVSWPGRFELCAEEPDFIVDGGHNPQCAETVAENLLRYYPDKKRVLLIGIMRDKDYTNVMRILAPCADAFVTVTVDSPRALRADELAEHLSRFGKPATPCDSVGEAVELAKELAGEDGMVCAAGSLYLAGEVRYALGMY